jgi:uroporphyrinogen decarboxylase
MPVVLGATRILSQAIGQEVPVLTSLKGPFSLAAFLMGVENFLMRLRSDPDTCRALLRFALGNQRRYADAIIAAGGIPFIGDPLASGDIISRRDFNDFVLPYLQELIRQLRTRPVGLHICGDTNDRLEAMRDTGAEILSVDEVDIGHARRALGNDVVLMGNVPTQLIHQGSADEVKHAAQKCLADAGPRMILSSACDVPRDAPKENVRAIVEQGREIR